MIFSLSISVDVVQAVRTVAVEYPVGH